MKRRAFTLVEVMVALIVSSIVLGAGYQIWSAARRDVATAHTRQILQSEMRKAIAVMARDFQMMKSRSLNVEAGSTGNSATITFLRYSGNADQNKLANERTEQVVYTFLRPNLTRKEGAKTEHLLATAIETMNLTRGGEGANSTAATVNDVPIDRQRGLNARMDISMSGRRRVPGMSKIIDHEEKVSVFIRDEYFSSLTDGKYFKVSALAATAAANLADGDADNSMLTMGELDAEALSKMTMDQLNALHQKETAALEENRKQIDELNGSISDLDTKTSGKLSINPYNWFAHGTDITKIQNDIKNHNTVEELENDIKTLDGKIDEYEKVNMEDSFKGKVPSFAGLDKDSQEYKDLKEAYDMMVRDRSMRKANEAANENRPEAERQPYTSLMENFNPSTMVRGQIPGDPPKTFAETEAQFQARLAHAQKLQTNSSKVDLTWMDSDEGSDRVKVYSAAKDLKDLAEMKKAYVEAEKTHETNITKIDDAKSKKG